MFKFLVVYLPYPHLLSTLPPPPIYPTPTSYLPYPTSYLPYPHLLSTLPPPPIYPTPTSYLPYPHLLSTLPHLLSTLPHLLSTTPAYLPYSHLLSTTTAYPTPTSYQQLLPTLTPPPIYNYCLPYPHLLCLSLPLTITQP